MSDSDFLPVPTAIERVTGTRPHPTTCWRWAIKGSRGTRLDTWMLGGRRMTTLASVRAFIAQRTKTTTPAPVADAAAVNKQLLASLK